MTITLKLAKIENSEVLKDISVEAFKSDSEQYGHYPQGIESLAWHQSEIEKGHYYKIQFNSELAGGICVIPSDSEHIEIKYFFISKNFQNKQIFSKIIELIEKEYEWDKACYLITPYKSYRNQYFYEKFGYKKVREIQPDPDNLWVDTAMNPDTREINKLRK